jgi:hypothetical protein
MNAQTPFQITPEALKAVASLLRQHPELQAALILIPRFDQVDEHGAVEAMFEREHIMMGYDSPDKFSQWPRVELCGQRFPVAPDALEKLKGKSLTIEVCEIIYVAGGKESNEFLVAA